MDRNEAIEIVRMCCPKISNSECDFETAMRVLVPELAESEDERIRKAIKHQIEKLDNEGWSGLDGVKYADILAWLEKQGQSKKNGYTIKNGELKPAEKCGIRLNISTFVTETKEPRLIDSKPFAIDDFKPFDKVLVKKDSKEHWHIQLFSHYNANSSFPYVCLFDCRYKYCVPYNDETKHLLGTTEEYNGKYKTW